MDSFTQRIHQFSTFYLIEFTSILVHAELKLSTPNNFVKKGASIRFMKYRLK